MPNLNTEAIVYITTVPVEIERRGGKRVNASTVWRWVHHGVKGVRLEALRLGNEWYTSREALQRFAERLTLQAMPEAPEVRFPSEVRRASNQAALALQDRGA
jgi:hypothetical protein